MKSLNNLGFTVIVLLGSIVAFHAFANESAYQRLVKQRAEQSQQRTQVKDKKLRKQQQTHACTQSCKRFNSADKQKQCRSRC